MRYYDVHPITNEKTKQALHNYVQAVTVEHTLDIEKRLPVLRGLVEANDMEGARKVVSDILSNLANVAQTIAHANVALGNDGLLKEAMAKEVTKEASSLKGA